jgi:hypothetical protein
MGIYARRDSPFWWVLLERPGEKPLLESTKIRRDPPSAQRLENRQLAVAYYHARLKQLQRAALGLDVSKPAIRFREYAAWYETHKIPKHRGAERDVELLARLRAFFGDDPLTAIDSARVDEYETHRLATPANRHKPTQTDTKTVSPNTVNREVDLLKAMLRDAVPKYLASSPLANRKRLRTVKRRKRIVQDAEEERKLLAVMSPVDRAFYLVARDSLMRLSNVINLRRSEDHGDHFALEDSKTGPYMAVISDRARAALDRLPHIGDFYFPRWRRGKTAAARRKAVSQWLRRKCQQAGVPYGRARHGLTFHTATRATGATHMLRTGADLSTVQGAGNWSDIRSMQTYLDIDHTRIRQAVNAAAPELDLAELERKRSVIRNAETSQNQPKSDSKVTFKRRR